MPLPINIADVSNDGLLYYERGSYGQTQVALVRRYLSALNESLQHSIFTRRSFIELFTDPGLYRNLYTYEWFVGAALHALTLEGFNHYVYASISRQLLGGLSTRYERYIQRPALPVYFIAGDCNDLARGIISETEYYAHTQGGTLVNPQSTPHSIAREVASAPVSLTFCLYQSEVLLTWDTVTAISQLPYVNLILYYPIDPLNRIMPTASVEASENTVDAFFGGKAWRDLYHRGIGTARHEQLIPYYCERLSSLGFSEIVTERSLNTLSPGTAHGTPSYYIIFAHKQPKTADFWQRVHDLEHESDPLPPPS
jgi:hypothetical protein